jgi:hypothetical protein
MSEKHLQILEWIFAGLFGTRRKSISDARVADSGIWFVNHERVKQWMESDMALLLFCIGNRKHFLLSLTSKLTS